MNRPVRQLRLQFVVALFIALFAFSPFIPVIIAAAIANAAGCPLSEAGASSCVIAGTDWGGSLYGLGALGWFGLFTVPCAGILIVCWLIWVLTTFIRAS